MAGMEQMLAAGMTTLAAKALTLGMTICIGAAIALTAAVLVAGIMGKKAG